MQKKLLGIAVATALTAPAVALAQVQVYGTANVTLNSTKYTDSTAGVGSVSKMAVNSHSSNFGIRSSETLGGGMTGWVQYEFNTQLERNNDQVSGNGTPRNSAIGLRGNFGNFYLGTWETPYASTFRMWDVGTVGGYGPSTSVAYRRESTGSAPSSNCNNAIPSATGGVVTTRRRSAITRTALAAAAAPRLATLCGAVTARACSMIPRASAASSSASATSRTRAKRSAASLASA